MKKMKVKVALVATILGVAGYNAYQSQSVMNGMSELALANVEALANGEDSDCPNGCLSDGFGCFCHYWFPTYREAN